MSTVILDLQIATEQQDNLPSEQQIMQWLEVILPQFVDNAEITIRIVDKEESQHLNHTYRNKDILDEEAEEMENIEIDIMAQLGFDNPYLLID